MGKKVVFKTYSQHQATLLPSSLEELIPADHIVRVISRVIDNLDMKVLLKEYSGGGTSSYHPRMMLKVWVLGYVMKVHSCRKLAKALREHLPFMWLSGNQHPDFRTLNDFRSNRMKQVIGDVFKQVVLFGVEQQYIDLSVVFTDGTKYQANANKHKAVWRKNIDRYKENLLTKLDDLLQQIDQENEQENKRYGNKDLEETGSHLVNTGDELRKKIDELSERINREQEEKQQPRQLKKAAKELQKQAVKLEQYENQQAVLAGRNSYAKTDTDATMMYSKDNQLLPCYNVQNSCQNQFIIHYTVGQNPNDATEFKPHIHTLSPELAPKNIVGDSIYGTEENYTLIENKGIGNYLMYSTFHAEQKSNFSKAIFRKENFSYDASGDSYTCPAQQKLTLVFDGMVKQRNKTFHEKHYQSPNCGHCPLRSQCCKGEGNRIIKNRPVFEAHKQVARANLNSEEGIRLRKQRGVQVETPFADIKHNQLHRRLSLRGLEKVKIEIGFMNLAHNFKKINSFMKNPS